MGKLEAQKELLKSNQLTEREAMELSIILSTHEWKLTKLLKQAEAEKNNDMALVCKNDLERLKSIEKKIQNILVK